MKAPKTWAELSAAAEKLKVPGGRAICLSPSWDRLLAFVYQNGGTFLNAAKTKSTVNTPAVTQAVKFYVGLIKSGVAGTPAQLGVGWCGEALGKEKAAIVFEGNWVVPFMGETLPDTSRSRTTRWCGASRTGISPSPSRTRWPATRRTSRPRGS